MLLQAAYDGDHRTFNSTVPVPYESRSIPSSVALILVVVSSSVAGLARALDKGRSRLRETVEAVTVEDEEMKGVGVLHLAASNGKRKMCAYLVEGVRMNIDAVDHAGLPLYNAQQKS